jgi:NAD(P)-dependent dehydrogenase (short-subunit alcohol dehydrogenase family)
MPAAKTVLITGCSAHGIGAAIALSLARRGHRVFATARDPSKIPSELSELSVVTTLALDVTSASSVASAVAAVEAATGEAGGPGGLDVLVNNAGLGYTMPLLDVDLDRAESLFRTNLWGVLRMVQGFSDLLIARRGRVVNISSLGAFVNTPWIGTCVWAIIMTHHSGPLIS